MQITFSNGKTLEYTQAYALERDFKDGYTRPSIEIHMPITQTSYNEIERLINSEAVKSFTLTGDEEHITDENGNEVIIPAVENTYEDYTIVGKITVEDNKITFKMFKLSDVERERDAAVEAVDELLLAMEEV